MGLPETTVSRRELIKSAVASLLVARASISVAFGEIPALERRGPRSHVLILGAGMAGLSAAYELERAGHRVLVVEARNRPGGRVRTLRRPFSGRLYAEAGATFLPVSHAYTMHYAHKFGVPLHQMAFDDRSSFYYVRNKLLRLADQPVPWPVDLTMEEQRLGIAGMFAKYIVPTIMQLGNIESPKWPAPDLEWLDRITFETFLRIKGASAGAISILRLGSLDLIGDGVGSASALSIIRDLSRTQELVSIVGGNDHLSGAFCEALDSQIRYGTRVREIVVRRDEVVLRTWSRAGAGVVSADYLICTVPFSTLSEMHVVPKWPEEKQIVIDAMRYTSVTRVFLQCRRRLWPEAHGLSNVSSDLPVMWMIDGSYSQRERRTVLECYIAGENSRRFSVMPKQRRVRAVVRSARNVFPDLPQVMESGCAYCWDNLRWSRGAYSWFSPGETVVMMRMAARREGRVFFAGEHTSPWPGWIQGALHSGYRAAVEVNEASRKPNNGFLE